jgi:hypothetical protein
VALRELRLQLGDNVRTDTVNSPAFYTRYPEMSSGRIYSLANVKYSLRNLCVPLRLCGK